MGVFMSNECDIMVIIAHPDDAEFGAAGSVAKWTAAGKSVVYVLCTNGDKGTSDRADDTGGAFPNSSAGTA